MGFAPQFLSNTCKDRASLSRFFIGIHLDKGNLATIKCLISIVFVGLIRFLVLVLVVIGDKSYNISRKIKKNLILCIIIKAISIVYLIS